MNESTVTPAIFVIDGSVRVELGDNSYLTMSPEAAINFGTKLIRRAEEAEGKHPSHLFIIPVGAK